MPWQKENGLPTIYGFAPFESQWTFVSANDAPYEFTRSKIAWPLWDAIDETPKDVTADDLERFKVDAENETGRLREPKLFHTNQFIIRTCGDHCEFGTVTSTEEEYFYPWRDIYPEKYRTYEKPLGKERQQELPLHQIVATMTDSTRDCFDLIFYCWLGSLKLLVLFFSPWVAIRWVARKKGDSTS